jgi:hypothetical protein
VDRGRVVRIEKIELLLGTRNARNRRCLNCVVLRSVRVVLLSVVSSSSCFQLFLDVRRVPNS